MNSVSNLIPDNGFYFGLGIFETIAVENNKCILLDEHLNRMSDSLKKLNINNPDYCKSNILERIHLYINDNKMNHGVLKISVTDKNIIFSNRENPYSESDYSKGFLTDFSSVLRNETSVFTFVKSLNYGDNLLGKTKAKALGIDEPIFINTKGEICEGATTNVFFIKDGKLFTPKTECGLLEGVLRNHIINNYEVNLSVIRPEDISNFNEMFLTNSLMGIMPVKKLGDHVFKENTVSNKILREYLDFVKSFYPQNKGSI